MLKITRHFIQNIQKTGEYDVAVLGRGYVGWPGEQEQYGCLIFPMNIGKPYPEIMREVSKLFRPQVIISCLDMWQIDWIEHAKQSDAVTNIRYISIYGKPVPFSWKKIVKSLDLAICYSEFGRSVLKEFMPFASLDMIHLGVDTKRKHFSSSHSSEPRSADVPDSKGMLVPAGHGISFTGWAPTVWRAWPMREYRRII